MHQPCQSKFELKQVLWGKQHGDWHKSALQLEELMFFRPFLRLSAISKISCPPVTISIQKENQKAKEDLQNCFRILHLNNLCKCMPAGTHAINLMGRPAPRKQPNLGMTNAYHSLHAFQEIILICHLLKWACE